MSLKLRVWAEYFTPLQAVEPQVVRLLKKYGVNLCIAFPPDGMNDDFARMMALYEAEGLETTLWVLMDDAAGYWANERNAAEFSDAVSRIFDWADAGGFRIPWIAVDLEMPYYQVERVTKTSGLERLKALRDIYGENSDRRRFREASAKYRDLLDSMHQRGTRAVTAVTSHIEGDVLEGTTNIQNVLETPITTVEWDVLSFMVYTSMIEQFARGFASRRDSLWYLYSLCSDMKSKLWDRAGVSLGCTYVGKLGNERYYDRPELLAPDVAAAKAALIDDIAIFNLEGILRSDRPEEWFEMIIGTEPRIPERSLKADLARAAHRLAAQWL